MVRFPAASAAENASLLPIGRDASGAPSSLDLSKATGLKNTDFCFHESKSQCASTTLRSAKSEQIDVHIIFTFPNSVGEALCLEWQELDHLLVQPWTTRSTRPVLRYIKARGNERKELLLKLLPGLTSRGIVTV